MKWEKIKSDFPVRALFNCETRNQKCLFIIGDKKIVIKSGKHVFEENLPEKLAFAKIVYEDTVLVGMKNGVAATVSPPFSFERKNANIYIKVIDSYQYEQTTEYLFDVPEKDPTKIRNITENPSQVVFLNSYCAIFIPDSAHFEQEGQTFETSEPIVGGYRCNEGKEVYGIFKKIDGEGFEIKTLKVRKKREVSKNETMAKDVVGFQNKAAMIYQEKLIIIDEKNTTIQPFNHTRLEHCKFSKFIGWTPGDSNISIIGPDLIPIQYSIELPIFQAWIEPDGLTAKILCDKNSMCVMDLC